MSLQLQIKIFQRSRRWNAAKTFQLRDLLKSNKLCPKIIFRPRRKDLKNIKNKKSSKLQSSRLKSLKKSWKAVVFSHN